LSRITAAAPRNLLAPQLDEPADARRHPRDLAAREEPVRHDADHEEDRFYRDAIHR